MKEVRISTCDQGDFKEPQNSCLNLGKWLHVCLVFHMHILKVILHETSIMSAKVTKHVRALTTYTYITHE